MTLNIGKLISIGLYLSCGLAAIRMAETGRLQESALFAIAAALWWRTA